MTPVPEHIFAIPGFSEPVSSLTHYTAALVALLVGPRLMRAGARSGVMLGALAVFVGAVVVLFVASGTYHLLEPGGTAREVLRRIDHAAIFILIAGTFTPVHIFAFRGAWRWGVLSLVWTGAIVGIVLKSVFFTNFPESLWLAAYLGVGWVGLVSLVKLGRDRGWSRVRLLFWGGVVYSMGAGLEFARLPTVIPHVVGPHELFHLAVVVAVAIHWRYIQQLVAAAPSWAHG